MSIDNDKKEFIETGERIKAAAKNNNLFEAMDIATSALKNAVLKNNQNLKDKYLSLVWAVHLMLEEEYASKQRREERNKDD